jgi:hypothetical protein
MSEINIEESYATTKMYDPHPSKWDDATIRTEAKLLMEEFGALGISHRCDELGISRLEVIKPLWKGAKDGRYYGSENKNGGN